MDEGRPDERQCGLEGNCRQGQFVLGGASHYFYQYSYFDVTGVSPNGNLYGTRNINDGQWHHVAGVYDGAHMYLYVDGALDVSQPATGLIAQNSDPLCLGANSKAYVPSCGCNELGYFFNGLIDEVSIYNRALSASEIQTIYAAGPVGKCPPSPTPPSITTQPVNQAVFVGGSATLSVTASGAPLELPVEFQRNEYRRCHQQFADADQCPTNRGGNYAVPVTNLYGSMLSSNAVLTVIPSGACTPAPSGLVSWWRAEGNANDNIGTNNGTPTGGITYTNGEVGQAFVFNNTTSYIPAPASPSLNIGIGSGFTIECWIQPNAFNVNGSGAPIVEWDSATTDGLQLWSQGVSSLAVEHQGHVGQCS